MKTNDLYIVHILESVAKIKVYTTGKSFEDFTADQQLQDAIARNLEIIGEASRRLPSELKTKIELPWDEISAMRNEIVHDYFELNLEMIWKTATVDVLEVEKNLMPYNPEKQ